MSVSISRGSIGSRRSYTLASASYSDSRRPSRLDAAVSRATGTPWKSGPSGAHVGLAQRCRARAVISRISHTACAAALAFASVSTPMVRPWARAPRWQPPRAADGRQRRRSARGGASAGGRQAARARRRGGRRRRRGRRGGGRRVGARDRARERPRFQRYAFLKAARAAVRRPAELAHGERHHDQGQGAGADGHARVRLRGAGRSVLGACAAPSPSPTTASSSLVAPTSAG